MAAIPALALGVMVALSACSGAGTPANTAASSGKMLTDAQVKAAGKVSISVEDYLSGSQLTSFQADIKQFEAEYPNVTVNASQKDFASYGKTIALTMSSNTAPDIAQANQAIAPRFVSGKLTRPLNSYVDAYGWAKTYPKGIQSGLRLAANGKGFGEGDYYGMAIGGNMVALYYNLKLLKAAGIDTPPKTFDEFEADMKSVKATGVQPLALGALEQYSASWIANTVIAHFANVDSVNNWVFAKSGATIATSDVDKGLQTLRNWVANGYISSNVNGTKDDDASTQFASGKAAFMIAGSWRAAQFDKGIGADGGTMLLPDASGGQTTANGNFSEAWTISSKSKHADVAAFFLNYLYGTKTLKSNIAGGWLPFAEGATSAGGPIAKDLLTSWYSATKGNLMTYLDGATPSMGNTYFPGLQSVLAGKETPSQLTTAMQSNWKSYTGK